MTSNIFLFAVVQLTVIPEAATQVWIMMKHSLASVKASDFVFKLTELNKERGVVEGGRENEFASSKFVVYCLSSFQI